MTHRSQPAHPGTRSDVGASQTMRAVLSVAAVAVLATASLGALTPGAVGRALDGIAIALVVAVPLVRVLALAVGFARERDLRFTGAAVALLVVVALGALVA